MQHPFSLLPSSKRFFFAEDFPPALAIKSKSMEKAGGTTFFDHGKLPSATGKGDVVFLSTKHCHVVGNSSEVIWKSLNDSKPGLNEWKTSDKRSGRKRAREL